MSPRAMTRYVFEEVRYPARKRVACRVCAKPVTRSTTFTATVNPWNVNENGDPRTRSEIVDVLRGKASAWMTEPAECTSCMRVRMRKFA